MDIVHRFKETITSALTLCSFVGFSALRRIRPNSARRLHRDIGQSILNGSVADSGLPKQAGEGHLYHPFREVFGKETESIEPTSLRSEKNS